MHRQLLVAGNQCDSRVGLVEIGTKLKGAGTALQFLPRDTGRLKWLVRLIQYQSGKIVTDRRRCRRIDVA